jgi:hypothetical protein
MDKINFPSVFALLGMAGGKKWRVRWMNGKAFASGTLPFPSRPSDKGRGVFNSYFFPTSPLL